MCVFNKDGIAVLDVTGQFDTDLVNTAWENRYISTIKSCSDEANKLNTQLAEIQKIPKLTAELREQLHKKIYPNLGAYQSLGIAKSYNNNVYNFGIVRRMRLKSFEAKYLLERYYRHLSRNAEPHDFAK